MTTPTDTRITPSRVMSQAEANLLRNVHGGNIMKMVDDTAGVSANRFAEIRRANRLARREAIDSSRQETGVQA